MCHTSDLIYTLMHLDLLTDRIQIRKTLRSLFQTQAWFTEDETVFLCELSVAMEVLS